MPLSPERVYEYLERILRAGEEAPRIVDIGKQFNCCPATIYKTLLLLENQGLITRSRKWRGIQLTEKS